MESKNRGEGEKCQILFLEWCKKNVELVVVITGSKASFTIGSTAGLS
jgi:hypothetical protein